MMRDCHLSRILLIRAIRNMCVDNSKWPADGLWYSVHDRQKKCNGFLCTADGFCRFKGDVNRESFRYHFIRGEAFMEG